MMALSYGGPDGATSSSSTFTEPLPLGVSYIALVFLVIFAVCLLMCALESLFILFAPTGKTGKVTKSSEYRIPGSEALVRGAGGMDFGRKYNSSKHS